MLEEKKNGQKDDTKLNQPKKCWDIDCQEAIDNRKKALKAFKKKQKLA